MSRAVDVGALLDASPWTTYQKLLTALAAFAVVFDGFDIQILAFAMPALIKDWHAVRSDFGPILAIGLAGMAIGGPLSGYVGDRFGRRPALITSVTLFGVATVATVFVNGLVGLAILRFLTGMGAGGALPNAGTLAAEFAPLRRRPLAVKFTVVCIPLGGMVGGLIASSVLPTLGWRALYAIGGAAPLLFALILWRFLPESPRFLARRPHLWPRLVDLLRRMGHPVEAGTVFEDRTETRAADRVSVRALFTPALRRDTIGLWFAFFFCLGSIYLVFGWLPTLLSAQGLSVATASTGLAVYNFGGVLGVLGWSVFMILWGSRGPLLMGALATAASALLLVPIAIHTGTDTFWLIAGLGLNGLLANAVQTSMYALAAHIYPTGVRASGVANAASIGRVGGLISSFFGGAVIHAGASAFWCALAVAMVLAFAGLAWVRNHFPASDQPGYFRAVA